MSRRPALTTAIVLAGLAGTAAQAAKPSWSQPANERATQQTLPQSKAPLWSVLATTRIGEDDKHGLFTAVFPAQVKALNGRTLTLSGFMLPLDTSENSRHFLLSRYTPVCFFCPPGHPNEIVEVVVKNSLPITDRMVSVTGRLTLAASAQKGMFFQMNEAIAR